MVLDPIPVGAGRESVVGNGGAAGPTADSQDSLFAVMCRGAPKATRDNLKALIAHYEWCSMNIIGKTPIFAFDTAYRLAVADDRGMKFNHEE